MEKITVKSNSGILALIQLNGETISAVKNSVFVQVIKNYEEANNIKFNVILTESSAESFDLLESGKDIR